MTDNILKQLRSEAAAHLDHRDWSAQVVGRLLNEAADKIERLSIENDELYDDLARFLNDRNAERIQTDSQFASLEDQLDHAHAILASEAAAWLVTGSNHEQSWRQLLTPAIQSYWDKYGNYFKGAR